jgi:hypothetical protein
VLKSFELHQNEKSDYDIKDRLNPNHYIGQALSIHVYDEKDNLLCDEKCLKSRIVISHIDKIKEYISKHIFKQIGIGGGLVGDPKAKCLIDGLNAINLKWTNMDPTTISSGFQYDKVKTYSQLREHHQIGCRESASKYRWAPFFVFY